MTDNLLQSSYMDFLSYLPPLIKNSIETQMRIVPGFKQGLHI